MSHEGTARECDIFNRGSSYFLVPRTTVCHTFCRMANYKKLESWIIIGLLSVAKREWVLSQSRLPSKNAHSPNYCSWLAVCVNYSANFYFKIALINRFKLYLVKTYSKTPKKQKYKQNVNKNSVEYILRLHLVNVTWRHPGWHCNVNRVTVKRWTRDTAQRRVRDGVSTNQRSSL